MPVIAEEGLVGHIISVTESTAKVQTIVDTASTISCTISNSNDSLIARGTLDKESNLKATYIPTDATILEGDKIETSGLGGIYPRGIYIGTVKKVESTKNITDRYAIIQTAVDFQKLDTVLVITQ
jgi:rod shape-determining protein MreC